MALQAGELFATLSLDTGEFDRGMSQVQNTTSGAGAPFSGLQALAGGAMLAIGKFAVDAAGKMVDFAKDCVDTGMKFDSAMSQVGATMGLTSEEINNGSETYEKLRNKALECGSTTKFSATESAEALNYMALAGYDAETSMDMLPKVLNLAAAGGMDLATTSDMVTDSLSLMGLGVGDADRLMDEMARTSQKSNTSVQQLGEAYKMCGGSASQLVGGTTELNTLLGMFANVGYKGGEGGTHLRNVLMSLSGTTDEARAKMSEMGISLYDMDGNMRPVVDVLQDFKGKLNGLTDEQVNESLRAIFNTTDIEPFKALLTQVGETSDGLAGSISNADGACKDMADTMSNNLEGDMTSLGSAMEGFKIKISDALTPALRGVAQGATGLVNKMSGAWDSIVAKTQDFVAKHQDAFNGLANFFGPVFETIKSVISSAWDHIKNIFSSAVDIIGGIIDVFSGLLTGDFDMMGNGLKTIVSSLWDIIKNIFSNAVDVIGGIIDVFAGLLTGDFDMMGNGLKTIVSSLWDIIKDIFANATNVVVSVVSGFVDEIKRWFSNLVSGALDKVSELVHSIPDRFRRIKDGAVNAIRGLPSAIGGVFSDIASRAWDWGSSILDGVVSGIKSKVSAVVDSISSVAGAIKDKFTGLLGIHSPSRVFAEYGDWIDQGLAIGIKNSLSQVDKATQDLVSVAIPDLPDQIKVPTLVSQEAEELSVYSNSRYSRERLQGGNSGFTLQIAEFNNNRNIDIEALMAEMATYIRASNRSGGN